MATYSKMLNDLLTKYTRQELSDYLDVSLRSIQNYIEGGSPRKETARKIQEIYINPDLLLKGTGNAEIDNTTFIVNSMIVLQAEQRVSLRALAEIHAHLTNKQATGVLAEYTNAVRKEIEVIKDELKH